jgi:hypothetical protein
VPLDLRKVLNTIVAAGIQNILRNPAKVTVRMTIEAAELLKSMQEPEQAQQLEDAWGDFNKERSGRGRKKKITRERRVVAEETTVIEDRDSDLDDWKLPMEGMRESVEEGDWEETP